MVRNTRPVSARYHAAANAERIKAGELSDVVLDSSRYVGIWQQEGNSSTAYGIGLGPRAKEHAEGYADMDLRVTDKDADGTPDVANGKLRWEVYDDPEQENLVAYSSTFRSENLRSAVNDSRTEKPVMHGQMPVAGDDSTIVLAFRADDANDGDTLTSGNCSDDLGIPYSRYK